jgi:hydrogenase nickel incorporation protein HypA/HybF
MHEFSLAVRMVELAETAARREGAGRIDRVHVEVGALSGVVPEALEFAFRGAREGTIAAGASLEVTLVPGVAYCAGCGDEFAVDHALGIAVCPSCDRPSSELRRGTELRVSHLEVA